LSIDSSTDLNDDPHTSIQKDDDPHTSIQKDEIVILLGVIKIGEEFLD
jgi:hypothetical protein